MLYLSVMDTKTLEASSALAWVVLNNFQNENQQPIEFKNHRFMIDIYADEHPDIVCKKSAQVGFSVMAILKCLWLLKYAGLNVIYALPTNNVVQDFVKPKVDPLISSNPAIADSMGNDSVSQKKVGDRFIYFKGGFSEREAISITGDILVIDEYDRMPSMQVVNTFDSRLQASSSPRRWRFSNPSQVGFGVDALYEDSDQMHWFVTCACGHRSFMDFEPKTLGANLNHYVDQVNQLYVCGKCQAEITDDMRRNGEWIPRFPGRKRRGYWISQMMAPWVTAARIIEQKEESNIEFFHNFVLGKAYTPQDMIVNRETILRANAPGIIPRVNVVMGVDQNANEQIYVIGTPQGIFGHGKTTSWEELERIKLMYNAVVVADPAPYPTQPKQLANKYSDFYLARFKVFNGIETVQWKGRDVFVDRTKLLDIVATEITQAKLLFREHAYALEDYIADWQNIYRTTVEKPDGKSRSEWLKKDNKESDFSLATAYFRLGLDRTLGSMGGTDFADPLTKEQPKADYVNKEGRLVTDLRIEEAYAAQNEPDWKHS